MAEELAAAHATAAAAQDAAAAAQAGAAAAAAKARGDQLVLAKEVKRLRSELAAAQQVRTEGSFGRRARCCCEWRVASVLRQ